MSVVLVLMVLKPMKVRLGLIVFSSDVGLFLPSKENVLSGKATVIAMG
jgi:hypothetical protein